MKSVLNAKALLRTNPLLSTNLKIVVDENYGLFMESIDSNALLSDDIFKGVRFDKSKKFEEIVPFFWKDIPNNIIFDPIELNDKTEITKEYSSQLDDVYFAGASKVSNKEYKEEFEYFAPIHFNGKLPSDFIIFRVDGTGFKNINKFNFRSEVLEKMKVVTSFDLVNTNLGDWIRNSISDNITYNENPIEVDFRRNEFSYINGIDVSTGGHVTKSMLLSNELKEEKGIFEIQKDITNLYKNNGIMYPNILNFSFLFNDTPSTKSSLRKWSINRYLGFYINKKDRIAKYSLYSPIIISNFEIDNNNTFVDTDNNYINPFGKKFTTDKTYVEYKGEFYKVEKNGDKYKIISPFNLSGLEGFINKSIIDINDNNEISFNPDYNTNLFDISDFEKADVWVIKINNKYHRIYKEGNTFKILSDYAFSINNNKLDYWINESDINLRVSVNLNNFNSKTKPDIVEIFRLDFTDIVNFDNDIVSTSVTSIEYEKNEELNDSEEPKIYQENIDSNTNPKDFEEFIINNEVTKVPTSSEYMATNEIYRINNWEIDNKKGNEETLSDIWNLNPKFLKWGFKGSVNNGDYPYLLNNNFIFDDMNRSTNVYEYLPSRVERNLDYFYTINPDSNEYDDYSLHITKYLNDTNIDTNYTLFGSDQDVGDIDKYIDANLSVNYVKWLLTKKERLSNGNNNRNTNKLSKFNKGNNNIPNETLFRGIKFKIYEVDKVSLNLNDKVESVSVKSNNNFHNWDFSIVASNNNIDSINGSILPSRNSQWKTIDNWRVLETYEIGDLVLYESILFEANIQSTIEDPTINFGLSTDWSLSNENTIFYRNGNVYNVGDFVFNNNTYYVYLGGTNIDFYVPGVTYNQNDKVIYRGIVYEVMVTNTANLPSNENDWVETVDTTNWQEVPIWQNSISVIQDDLVVYDNSLYKSLDPLNSTNVPTDINSWELIYTFDSSLYMETLQSNSNLLYDNVIYMNNKFYFLKSGNGILDNGINIYINKKYKNILINIYINDNTIALNNLKRDDSYTEISQKLVAKNFMNSLNDLSNNYSFQNSLSYYIIEEDFSFTKYNVDNYVDLPFIIITEDPEEINVVDNTLLSYPIKQPIKFSINNSLSENEITETSDINDYNGTSIGVGFKKAKIIGDRNITLDKTVKEFPMFRFNGFYSPVLNEVEIFKRSEEDTIYENDGNYIFDNELTNFGTISEILISKTNPFSDILKLKNFSQQDSIYPKIDEFGNTYKEHFIFKSPWDVEFFVKVIK